MNKLNKLVECLKTLDVYFETIEENKEIIIPMPCDAVRSFGTKGMLEIIKDDDTAIWQDEAYVHVLYNEEYDMLSWLIEIERY